MTEKKKIFKTTSIEKFDEACKRLNLSGGQLSEAIGYTKSAYPKWEREKKIPVVAGLAAEALVRRAGPGAGKEKFVLLHFHDGDLTDYREMSVKPMTLRFNDQEHYLIPVLKS